MYHHIFYLAVWYHRVWHYLHDTERIHLQAVVCLCDFFIDKVFPPNATQVISHIIWPPKTQDVGGGGDDGKVCNSFSYPPPLLPPSHPLLLSWPIHHRRYLASTFHGTEAMVQCSYVLLRIHPTIEQLINIV